MTTLGRKSGARFLAPASGAALALLAVATFSGCFVSFDGYQLAEGGASGAAGTSLGGASGAVNTAALGPLPPGTRRTQEGALRALRVAVRPVMAAEPTAAAQQAVRQVAPAGRSEPAAARALAAVTRVRLAHPVLRAHQAAAGMVAPAAPSSNVQQVPRIAPRKKYRYRTAASIASITARSETATTSSFWMPTRARARQRRSPLARSIRATRRTRPTAAISTTPSTAQIYRSHALTGATPPPSASGTASTCAARSAAGRTRLPISQTRRRALGIAPARTRVLSISHTAIPTRARHASASTTPPCTRWLRPLLRASVATMASMT